MQSYQDLKTLTKKELLEALNDARQELLQKRITVKTKHEKDTSLIQKQKQYIARLLTALKEIELEEKVANAHKID